MIFESIIPLSAKPFIPYRARFKGRYYNIMATICIVDDEPDIRAELGSWLEDYGYKVISAPSAAEALDQIREKIPNLVILDIIMPEIDGLDFLARLKANPLTAGIPVIMLSAKKETTTIIKAQGLQAADYFMKPFESEDFLKSIQRFIA